MTVGICYDNGKEAIAVTDCRVSYGGRQSDSVNKMSEFDFGNYRGVVFGAGNGDTVFGTLKRLEDSKSETLEGFVRSIHEKLKEKAISETKMYNESAKADIEARAVLIADNNERKKFIENEIGRTLRKNEDYRNNRRSVVAVVAYDITDGKIKKFGINDSGYVLGETDNISIGSGEDGANFYATTKLPGLDLRNLSPSDLAFLASNSYCFSTINGGVGGTPRIARIREKGKIMLPDNETLPLVCISGAHLAGFSEALTQKASREFFKDILDEKADYKKIAEVLGITEDTLRSMYLPYSSWQERANKRNFQ